MATSKQDRSGVRTASDLERKYDLAAIVGIKQAVKNSVEGINKTNTTLEEFMKATLGSLEELQNQIDGNITTWFYNGEPTLSNTPANEWATEEEKANHIGDLYYDKDTGYSYRFTLNNGVYEWFKISDSDVTEALALANAASDTADSKRRVFIVKPVPPYDSGDLWFNNSEIYICQISKPDGESYVEKDFIIATKYTDDTYARQVGDELEVVKGTVTTIKEGVDKFEVDITTTVNAQGKEIEAAKTSIAANTEEINLRVKKNGIIGAINLSEEEALIQAEKINLVGAVTISSLDKGLKTTIDDASYDAANAVNTAYEALDLSQSTNTVSGSPILLTDCAEGKIINFAYDENIGDISNLEVKITNKNFVINEGVESYTANDVTFTKNEDGSVTIVGTPTANTSYDISRSIYLPAGSNIINGFPNIDGRLTVVVDGVNRSSTNGGELEFEVVADGTYRTLIVVNAGVTYNHTVYPMIRPVGTDEIYKPHQEYIVNIPITESLTEDVQEAIRNMPTYVGGTYITATSGCNMEVEYYRNTVTGQQLADIYNTAKNADDVIAQWCYENDTTIIDGGKIATRTITADKISVNDLSSLSAKIGKLTIDENGILTSTFVHDTDIVEEGSLTDDYININYDYLAPSVNDYKIITGSTKLGFEKLSFNRTNGYTEPHYSVLGQTVSADEVTTLYKTDGISWTKNYINEEGSAFSSSLGAIKFYDKITQVGMNVRGVAECELDFYDVIVNNDMQIGNALTGRYLNFNLIYGDSITTTSGANLDTIYSDLYKSDFGTPVDITGKTAANPYIAESDGYLRANSWSSTNSRIYYINDVVGTTPGNTQEFVFIKKGMKLYGGGAVEGTNVMFYPLI